MTDHTCVVCDFDGTLVDTKEAVEKAYMHATGELFLQEYWGKPWHEWCTPRQKHYKDEVYPEYVEKFAKLTPLGERINWEKITILTGASSIAVRQVTRHFFGPKFEPNMIGTSCNLDGKHMVLKGMACYEKECYYVDDNLFHGIKVVEGTQFNLCLFDKDAKLMCMITQEGDIDPWMSSYSLLERMNVLKVSSPRTTSP